MVLPTTALRPMLGSQWVLRRTLAHEFFHIFSRNNPKLRSSLYEAIGFRHCGKVELPVVLRTRMITNPDAPRNEHCIRVQLSGKSVWAVPILHPPRFEEATGFDLNTLLVPSLLLVEKDSSGVARPIVGADGPLLVGIDRVTGLFEQIGRNTSYIIHPEEILAENASLLTLGARHFPSPEILNKIEGLLREARAGDPGPGEDGGKVSPAPDRDCADVR
jgi:hypothetical protein